MKYNILALLFLILILIIVFFPVLFQGRVLLPLGGLNTMELPYAVHYDSVEVYNHAVSDAYTQYYPYTVFTKQAWESKNLAFWYPYYYGGYPVYAETMSGHFDVTNIVLLLFDMPTAFHFQIIFQLLIAGFGMFLLLRLFNISFFSSLLFASAYMLNSWFIMTLLHRWIVASFCWVPYIVLFLTLFYQKRKLYYIVLSGLFTAFSFLGGSFQTSAFVVFLLFAYNLLNVVQHKHVLSIKSVLIYPLTIFLIGFFLSAIMWLPSLEMLRHDILEGGSAISHRYTSSSSSFFYRLISIPFLISFFIPEIVGSVRGFFLLQFLDMGGHLPAFIGFLPLWFGLFGGILLWKKMREVRIFMILAVLGIILPLFTPLDRFIYLRFFIVFIFCITIVAAISFEVFIKRNYAGVNWKRCIKYSSFFMGLLFLGLIIINIAVSVNHEFFHSKAREYLGNNISRGQLSAGNKEWMFQRIDRFFDHFSILSPTMFIPFLCVGFLCLLIYLYSRTKRYNPRWLLIGAIPVTLFQLTFFSYSWLPMCDTDRFPLYPKTKSVEFLLEDHSHFRVLPLSDRKSQRVFQPNILAMYEIPTITGYESIIPRNLDSLVGDTLDPRLLGLANVKYIITSIENPLNNPFLKLVESSEVHIYENLKWMPRAYMKYRHETLGEDQILTQFHNGRFDESTVYFGCMPHRQINHDEKEIGNHVELLLAKSNYLKLSVETEKDGYFVLTDTYYPGWKAYINGRSERIYRANYSMRCILLEKGRHSVEFVFSPDSYKIGKLISILALITCFISILSSYLFSRTNK